MLLDRFVGDIQGLSDLFVRQAIDQLLEDFTFSLG